MLTERARCRCRSRSGQIAGSVEQIAWAQDGASLLVLAADPGLDTASAHNATTIRGEH